MEQSARVPNVGSFPRRQTAMNPPAPSLMRIKESVTPSTRPRRSQIFAPARLSGRHLRRKAPSHSKPQGRISARYRYPHLPVSFHPPQPLQNAELTAGLENIQHDLEVLKNELKSVRKSNLEALEPARVFDHGSPVSLKMEGMDVTHPSFSRPLWRAPHQHSFKCSAARNVLERGLVPLRRKCYPGEKRISDLERIQAEALVTVGVRVAYCVPRCGGDVVSVLTSETSAVSVTTGLRTGGFVFVNVKAAGRRG